MHPNHRQKIVKRVDQGHLLVYEIEVDGTVHSERFASSLKHHPRGDQEALEYAGKKYCKCTTIYDPPTDIVHQAPAERPKMNFWTKLKVAWRFLNE